MGIITEYQRFSIHDGPGIRTIIFFKGCPLRCKWCANPETQEVLPEMTFNSSLCIGCLTCVAVCPKHVITPQNFNRVGKERSKICWDCKKCVDMCPREAISFKGMVVTAAEAAEEAMKDETFFKSSGGGVTISGGEPFAQFGFLKEVLHELKLRGAHTAIESCLYTSWENIEAVLPELDYILCDLKNPIVDIHKYFTGVDPTIIKGNIRKLMRTGKPVLVRIPVIPGVNTDQQSENAFIDFFKEANVKRVELLPYHILGVKKYEILGKEYPGKDFVFTDTDRCVEKLNTALSNAGIEVIVNK